jgi:hypothetical protein
MIKVFLARILPMIRGIQVKQHIVEGEYVATVFDMETVNGVDHVCDRIHIVDGDQGHTQFLLFQADRIIPPAKLEGFSVRVVLVGDSAIEGLLTDLSGYKYLCRTILK